LQNFVKKSEGWHMCGWEDNIKMAFKYIVGYGWLRLGSSSQLLWTQCWTIGFHKRWGIIDFL